MTTYQERQKAIAAKLEAENELGRKFIDRPTRDPVKLDFFTKISQISPDDHEELQWVKSKMRQLIAEELEELEFKDKVSEEDASALSNELSTEVASNSNFYFSYDKDKVSKNTAVVNLRAPGNKHRKPNVLLGHEHVHPQHYINTEGLTEEKLQEIYAYYSLLVDLHISQIRPGNLNDANYVPAHFNSIDEVTNSFDNEDNLFWDYYHSFRETPGLHKGSDIIQFEEDLKNRPTTDHYDHDKGSKYDVEWTEDQKFPHVACRLGYPILAETPLERALEVEVAPANPGYQF